MSARVATRLSVRAMLQRALLLLALPLLFSCQTTRLVNGVPTAPDAPRSSAESSADTRKRAEVRLQLAATYLTQGQPQVAIDEAHRALAIDPNLASAYGLLGLIFSSLDDKAQAEANFERAVRLEPDNPEIDNNYGWYLCRHKREKDALPYFDRAAANRLYETPGMPLQNAGICLLQIGDRAGAERYLQRALQADASSPVVKNQLARLYLMNDQLDKAKFYVELLQKNVDPNPQVLWLALRIAHAGADVAGEQKLGDELRKRFPDSAEAGALQRGAYNE